jgi:hypothetical protein
MLRGSGGADMHTSATAISTEADVLAGMFIVTIYLHTCTLAMHAGGVLQHRAFLYQYRPCCVDRG